LKSDSDGYSDRKGEEREQEEKDQILEEQCSSSSPITTTNNFTLGTALSSWKYQGCPQIYRQTQWH
jgi:hypothetical protein